MGRHIGIVAVSAEGAALCYRTICGEARELFGVYGHPQVTMHTFSFREYMKQFTARRWSEIAKLLAASAQCLRQAGAQLLICPDNTVHEAFDYLPPRSPLPWLHIAEEVGAVAARQGYRKVGILGTRSLMEGPVYPRKLDQFGIAHTAPNQESREQIDKIIFEELVHGRVTDPARAFVSGVIRELERQGCDAVVLGCTELPLLIRPQDSSLPTLDSTRLLALAALRCSVNGVAQRWCPAAMGTVRLPC